jgi:hypothetical protein
MEGVMYRGQLCQVEAHLDEGLPHHEIERGPAVNERLGHLMALEQYLYHERQVSLGGFCIWVVFRSEQDANIEPLHHPSWLNALRRADLTLDLFSLCLRGDGHAILEDHIDLSHLFITV